MSLVAVGLTEVLLVELLDHGVLMALTQGLAGILAVQGGSADDAGVTLHTRLSGHDGLAAAVDAAAGATHDLDEVIGLLAAADGIQQLGSVGSYQ